MSRYALLVIVILAVVFGFFGWTYIMQPAYRYTFFAVGPYKSYTLDMAAFDKFLKSQGFGEKKLWTLSSLPRNNIQVGNPKRIAIRIVDSPTDSFLSVKRQEGPYYSFSSAFVDDVYVADIYFSPGYVEAFPDVAPERVISSVIYHLFLAALSDEPSSTATAPVNSLELLRNYKITFDVIKK